jgi:hypothetical protein
LDGNQCFDDELGKNNHFSNSYHGQEYDWSVWDDDEELNLPCDTCHNIPSFPDHSIKYKESYFPGGYLPELPDDLSGYSYETENMAPPVSGMPPMYPYIPNKVTATYYVGSVADIAKDVLQYLVAYQWATSEQPPNVFIFVEYEVNENYVGDMSNHTATVFDVAVANLSNSSFHIAAGVRDGDELFAGDVYAGEIKTFTVNQEVALGSEILIGMNNWRGGWWADSMYIP